MTGTASVAPIGIFGGTFDPIHYGHLRTAFELLHALGLREVRFVPAGHPPHRGQAPLADGLQRLELVRQAIADEPRFALDEREVRRAGPSYTVLTLAEMRSEEPDASLCLIVGMDAFLGLPEWHRWQELLDLAHVVVASRPGYTLPVNGVLADLLVQRRTDGIAALRSARSGRILVHPVTQLKIASTELRELLARGDDPRYLVPEAVRHSIRRTACYSQFPQPTR